MKVEGMSALISISLLYLALLVPIAAVVQVELVERMGNITKEHGQTVHLVALRIYEFDIRDRGNWKSMIKFLDENGRKLQDLKLEKLEWYELSNLPQEFFKACDQRQFIVMMTRFDQELVKFLSPEKLQAMDQHFEMMEINCQWVHVFNRELLRLLDPWKVLSTCFITLDQALQLFHLDENYKSSQPWEEISTHLREILSSVIQRVDLSPKKLTEYIEMNLSQLDSWSECIPENVQQRLRKFLDSYKEHDALENATMANMNSCSMGTIKTDKSLADYFKVSLTPGQITSVAPVTTNPLQERTTQPSKSSGKKKASSNGGSTKKSKVLAGTKAGKKI